MLKNTTRCTRDAKAAFSPEAIRLQLQNILISPDFEATGQQRALLEFVITQTLAGNSKSIKGYTIATQVFGRDENFDQAIDPIVSIQAHKLRRSLERYYLLSGKNDTIQIDMPKGRYLPAFSRNAKIAAIPTSHKGIDQQTNLEDTLPAILIRPFRNLTNDPKKNFWGAGFAAELATEINQFKWINVLQYSPRGRCRRSSDTGAHFIIDGCIREDRTGVKLVVNLLDAKANKLLWSDRHCFESDVSQIILFQEKVAAIVGTTVAGKQGVITKNLLKTIKNKPPDQLNTYEAILRCHKFDQTLLYEHFSTAFDALEEAGKNEPECGQVWSFLAWLHAKIFSLEIPGFAIANSEKKALEYAERGVALNQGNQEAVFILALVRMLTDDIAAARRDIQRAYKINPASLYLMDGIGYIKTLLGDREMGPDLIRKSIKLNPYYKPMVHYALWVEYLRQNDFEKAFLETSDLHAPFIFWYPLAKASTLGLLGRIDEGKKFADDLLALKPDFPKRGRILLGRYIKFKEITNIIVQGLTKIGVSIE